MSEHTINDAVEDKTTYSIHDMPEKEQIEQQKPSILEYLKTPTGEGSIEEYMEHSLNFNKSRGMAQIIRGFTGFLGQNLNLAIVDVAIGVLDLVKTNKSKGVTNHDVYRGTSNFS